MAGTSSLFKPNTKSSYGSKKMDDGQFANPPAFPEVSGFTGAEKVAPQSPSVMPMQKTPTAHKGKV